MTRRTRNAKDPKTKTRMIPQDFTRRFQLPFVFLIAIFAGHCGSALPTSSLPLPAVDSNDDVAQITSVSAGGLSLASSAGSPALEFLKKTKLLKSRPRYQIEGFTFDETTGIWTGTTEFGATPSLKFYKKSDSSLITVDVTDTSNYFPGGALEGVTPPGEDDTGVQIEIIITVSNEFQSGSYKVEATLTSGKLDATDANTDPSGTYSYTGEGTISGEFGSISMSNIALTASNAGETVTGSYEFSSTIDSQTYTGSVSFTEDGCDGATIKDASGNLLGTAELNENGELTFTDATTGETTKIDRIET